MPRESPIPILMGTIYKKLGRVYLLLFFLFNYKQIKEAY